MKIDAREQAAQERASNLGLGTIRFEQGRVLLIAGENKAYNAHTRTQIPDQWDRFAPHIGKVPGQIGQASYGVCWNNKPDGTFDYLSGVEVAEAAKQPSEFARVALPARPYAVFTHGEHVSSLPQTIDTIWSRWVPECELSIAKAPCFERYTEEFDPQTGRGGMEIWIPLEGG